MTNLRSKFGRGLAILAMVAAPAILGASAASARVDVGINVGIPGIVVGPPPVVYAQPPVVYAPPPPVVVGPAPVVVAGGYWWYDGYGHRHWRYH